MRWCWFGATAAWAVSQHWGKEPSCAPALITAVRAIPRSAVAHWRPDLPCLLAAVMMWGALQGHWTTHAAASTSAPVAAAAAALRSGPCRRSLHRRAQHAQQRLAPSAATPHHSTSTTTTITGTSTPTSSSSSSSESADPFALTKSIMERVDRLVPGTQAGGAGGRTTYAAFKAADEQWSRLRTQQVKGGGERAEEERGGKARRGAGRVCEGAEGLRIRALTGGRRPGMSEHWITQDTTGKQGFERE